jgi:hypothetical protein
MPLVSRKAILAIAAVVDIALDDKDRPVSARAGGAAQAAGPPPRAPSAWPAARTISSAEMRLRSRPSS